MSRSTSLVLASHAGITIPLMLWLVPAFGNYGAVVAMLTASILTVPLNVILLGRAIQFGAPEIVDMIWCPLASSLAMSAVVLSVKLYWEIPSTLLRESRMLARYRESEHWLMLRVCSYSGVGRLILIQRRLGSGSRLRIS